MHLVGHVQFKRVSDVGANELDEPCLFSSARMLFTTVRCALSRLCAETGMLFASIGFSIANVYHVLVKHVFDLDDVNLLGGSAFD